MKRPTSAGTLMVCTNHQPQPRKKRFSLVSVSILCIIVLCVFQSISGFSQNAISNPSVGTWITYSGVYTCGYGYLTGTTFNQIGGPGSGPDTAVKGRIANLNDSVVTIELQKQTGTSYFQYGEIWGTHNYNNPDALCGSIKYDYQVITNNPTTVTVQFKHYATFGNGRDMYVIYRNFITGKNYFVGHFYISIPNMPGSLTGSITGLSFTWQHNKPAYITSQVKSNGGTWSGNVRLSWYSGNGNYITYLLDSPVNNLPNNQTKNINFTTNNVQSSGGSYVVKLEYKPTGASNYVMLDSRTIVIYGCPQPFTLNSQMSHLRWPFPSGSTANRDNWYGANEPQGTGSGYGQGGHWGSDYYAVDWNKMQTQDCDLDFHSPLGGTVIKVEKSFPHECNDDGIGGGYGNTVVILSNVDNTYAFRIAHLNTVYVSEKQGVNVGDKIGTIGSTGNSTASHAHCVLYRNVDAKLSGLMVSGYADNHATPFDFSAECYGDGGGGGTVVRSEILSIPSSISPNPTTGITHVDVSDVTTSNTYDAYIYNMVGSVVKTFVVTRSKFEFDLSSFPNGVYVLMLYGKDNSIATHKIVLHK